MLYQTIINLQDAEQLLTIGLANQAPKLIVILLLILSLEKEAELMKAMGCSEAMNLDGGASRALAYRGQIIIPAGRKLTNVIVAHDRLNPAPEDLKDSWRRFQQGEKAKIPI